MKPLPPISFLLPGDVLIYRPSDLAGVLIAIKTWGWYSHVEGYLGNTRSLGARAEGVKVWPVRIDSYLSCIRRPGLEFDPVAAFDAPDVQDMLNRGYDFGGLFSFFLPKTRARLRHNGICSVLVAAWLTAGHVKLFNPELDLNKVAPAQLYQTAALKTVWEA